MITTRDISEILGNLSQIEAEIAEVASVFNAKQAIRNGLQIELATALKVSKCNAGDIVSPDGGGKIYRVTIFDNQLQLERVEVKNI